MPRAAGDDGAAEGSDDAKAARKAERRAAAKRRAASKKKKASSNGVTAGSGASSNGGFGFGGGGGLRLSAHKLNVAVDVEVRGRQPSIAKQILGCFFLTEKKTFVRKPIISDASVDLRPGRMYAVIGASGSGKTTLLDLLAHRKNTGHLSGAIAVNGEPRDATYRTRLSAYVMQDDLLRGHLSVREMLQYSAHLRLSSDVPAAAKMARVEEVIDVLGLRGCADTTIGVPGEVKGISGGERKRVSIGVELITRPSVLFLDEPTSSLDSFNAFSVVDTVQRLARAGQTVVMTIHQPRSDVFAMFDRLIWIDRGRIVYTGTVAGAVAYVKRLGHKCPKNTNPADFFLDLVSARSVNSLADDEIAALPAQWAASKGGRAIEAAAAEQTRGVTDALEATSSAGSGGGDRDGAPVQQYATPVLHQFATVLRYTLLETSRNPFLTHVQVVQRVFLAVLVGFLYFQVTDDDEGAMNRAGSFYLIIANLAFSLQSLVGHFINERSIFMREQASGFYRTSAFFFAQLISLVPTLLLSPLLFGLILFPIVGFSFTVAKFLVFLLLLVLCSLIAGFLMLFFSSFFKTQEIANVMAAMCIVIFMIFGGFFANLDTIPAALGWLQWLSFFKYVFEGLMVNEFTGLALTCDDDERIDGQCPTPNGEHVLRSFAMQHASVERSVAVLSAMIVVLGAAAYASLRFKNKERR